MEIIDISLPLSEGTITHPKEPPIKFEPQRDLVKDGVASTKITLGTHIGTHIDVPSHFIYEGKTVDKVDLENLLGKCQVLEVTPTDNLIKKADIEDKIVEKRVLFKTANSGLLTKEWTREFISLSLEAAHYLIGKGVVLVGIDYTGIEASGSPGHPVHKALLENNVTILEGLNLVEVSPGSYEIIVLPLNLKGLDGAPSRAILIKK
jgi:arylformamidase